MFSCVCMPAQRLGSTSNLFPCPCQVRWIPEVGLVSASLDATIKTFDINRERITHTCSHHAKGVHAFVWCKAYSCFASCGLERDVTVWHVSGRDAALAGRVGRQAGSHPACGM